MGFGWKCQQLNTRDGDLFEYLCPHLHTEHVIQQKVRISRSISRFNFYKTCHVTFTSHVYDMTFISGDGGDSGGVKC